jgi:AcrR family transcriptional regulator
LIECSNNEFEVVVTPRKYEMDRRAAAVEETRLRILKASLALHGEKGFEATSWKDIADRADVAVGTVYHHFKTMDDLVPACAALARSAASLPGTEIFDGVDDRDLRIDILTREVVDLYPRIAPGFANVQRERHRFAAVEQAAAELERALDLLVRRALGKGASSAVVKRVNALLDFRVWDAFQSRSVSQAAIASTIARSIRSILED